MTAAVTIAASLASADVIIWLADDGVVEGDESVVLMLHEQTAYRVGLNRTANFPITDRAPDLKSSAIAERSSVNIPMYVLDGNMETNLDVKQPDGRYRECAPCISAKY